MGILPSAPDQAGQRITGMMELPTGTPIGKYEVVRKIATGGMAEIYLARARGTAGFEKVVVLKRILPHLAGDPTFVQMFLDEARLAATLQHPNIADVYDVGDAEGAYFFTMEYLHGQDVRALRHAERARGQRVPLAIALAIVHGTLAALDYAHEKRASDGTPLGLVHRDVSSSNILVSYEGAIKLVDFGIARASGAQHKTRTGTLKGKVPYMSPEQARGMSMDRRSDLFSLGVVLYELTVGRRPFRGDSDFAILEKIVHYGAKPPSQVIAGYPAELEALVMKLLARDPAQRFATGEDALHELEQIIAQYSLWVSPKVIGKYMRSLFAAEIEAWHKAEQQGIPFEDHVAQTIHRQRGSGSDLVTPPSAFPAARPPDDDDRDGGDDDSLAYPMEGSAPITVAPPLRASQPTGPVAVIPAIIPAAPRPSRAKWVAIAFVLLAAAGGGGYVAVTQLGATPADAPRSPPPATATATPTTVHATTSAATIPTPSQGSATITPSTTMVPTAARRSTSTPTPPVSSPATPATDPAKTPTPPSAPHPQPTVQCIRSSCHRTSTVIQYQPPSLTGEAAAAELGPELAVPARAVIDEPLAYRREDATT